MLKGDEEMRKAPLVARQKPQHPRRGAVPARGRFEADARPPGEIEPDPEAGTVSLGEADAH